MATQMASLRIQSQLCDAKDGLSSRSALRGVKCHVRASANKSSRNVFKVSAVSKPSGSSSGVRKSKKPDVSTSAVALDAPEMVVEELNRTVKADKKQQKQRIRMRIDGEWYDMTGWAKAHPGGAKFITLMDGRDATDAFYALHSYGPNGSDKALKMLEKFPRCEAPDNYVVCDEATAANCTSFREFRTQLEDAGWFERNWLEEFSIFAQVTGLFTLGTYLAWNDQPWLATLVLGFAGQQAGWLGHDYVHGRGPLCEFLRPFAAVTNGHDAEWWSQKHNMHHIFTNQDGKDEDIMQEPFFFLRPPEIAGRGDTALRKYQHIYGYPAYGVTFWYWRIDSLKTVWEAKDKKAMAMLGLNYLWMATLPWQVALGHVTLAGFLVGALVSATHQSEEIMDEQGEFMDVQFRSTRDAEENNPFLRWMWGGMDTQLEHHLFPTMPRYKYHKLRPVLKSFAEANGLNFRISPSAKIIKDNWHTLKKVAES